MFRIGNVTVDALFHKLLCIIAEIRHKCDFKSLKQPSESDHTIAFIIHYVKNAAHLLQLFFF